MMKSLALATLALCLAACASAPAGRPSTAQAAATPLAPPACVPHTATRLPVKERDCEAFGQSYTSEDIHRTGQTDVGSALGLLNPAVTAPTH